MSREINFEKFFVFKKSEFNDKEPSILRLATLPLNSYKMSSLEQLKSAVMSESSYDISKSSPRIRFRLFQLGCSNPDLYMQAMNVTFRPSAHPYSVLLYLSSISYKFGNF